MFSEGSKENIGKKRVNNGGKLGEVVGRIYSYF